MQGYNSLVATTGYQLQGSACLVVDNSLRANEITTIDGKVVKVYLEITVTAVPNWTDPTQATEAQDKQVVAEAVAHRNGRKPKLVK